VDPLGSGIFFSTTHGRPGNPKRRPSRTWEETMQTGWIALGLLAVLAAWGCWIAWRGITAPSAPFGEGGYGSGPESEKHKRHRAAS
jgi:hypothetical protein